MADVTNMKCANCKAKNPNARQRNGDWLCTACDNAANPDVPFARRDRSKPVRGLDADDLRLMRAAGADHGINQMFRKGK